MHSFFQSPRKEKERKKERRNEKLNNYHASIARAFSEMKKKKDIHISETRKIRAFSEMKIKRYSHSRVLPNDR
jgi:hypothetical protein